MEYGGPDYNSTRRPNSDAGAGGTNNNNEGNVELVQQLRQAVRLAVMSVIRQQQYPAAVLEHALLPLPPTSLHGRQRAKRSSGKDELSEQDAHIWEILRTWMAQDEHHQQADQPHEIEEGSGGDVVVVGQQQLPDGKVIGKEAEPVVSDEVDEEPAAMALAESLILLHPPVMMRSSPPPSSSKAAHQEGSEKSSIRPVNINETAEVEKEAVGAAPLVFAYDDHVIEIVQLDPPLPLPPPPLLLLLNKTTAYPASAEATGRPVSPDQPSHPSAEADELFSLPSASVNNQQQDQHPAPLDSHSSHDTLLRPFLATRIGIGNVTSNDVLPPDPDGAVITDAGESNDFHHPIPSSDWLTLMAGNISEDILTIESWPDVISYRGPIVHLPTVDGECDCSCPCMTAETTTSMTWDATTFDPQNSPTEATTTVPHNCPTLSDHEEIKTCPTPPTCPTTAEQVTCPTCPEMTTLTSPVCPICPTVPTTPLPTPSTTTQLIPPILILEGKCRAWEGAKKKKNLPTSSPRRLTLSAHGGLKSFIHARTHTHT